MVKWFNWNFQFLLKEESSSAHNTAVYLKDLYRVQFFLYFTISAIFGITFTKYNIFKIMMLMTYTIIFVLNWMSLPGGFCFTGFFLIKKWEIYFVFCFTLAFNLS